MNTDLAVFERGMELAVRQFWESRTLASSRQQQRGASDQGERAGVTAGHNMDGFARLFADVARANGLGGAALRWNRGATTLPGFFRPTKTWDFVIVHRQRLVAAIELKSQVGPSFGNNFNNRAEEAIGTAADFWAARRQGAFGKAPPPFLGWLILVEDCAESRRPVRQAKSPGPGAFPEFASASYLDRYAILGRKLMDEGLYTSAAVVASDRQAGPEGRYSDVGQGATARQFAQALAARAAAEATEPN